MSNNGDIKRNDVSHEEEIIKEEKEEEREKEELLYIDPKKVKFKKLFNDEDIVIGEEFLKLGKPMTFLSGDYVLERLGIADKTLTTLAESGEFALGRIAGRIVIIAETFFDFLDRYHFTKRENPDDPVAIDPKGKILHNLTYVKKKHTYVPKLRPIKDFAEDLGLEDRTFTRHCEIGTFTHYRIGSLYKMSEEDYTESLMRAALAGMKSNRGGGAKRTGRPNEVQEKIEKRLREIIEKEDENQ